MMAKDYDLKSPQPIMCTTPQSGDFLHMFQSGSKYYIWNLIEDDVWEIRAPLVLEDITAGISKLGVGSLKVAPVPQVSTCG